MKTLESFLTWHRKINNVHAITQDLYEKIEIKFK